VRHESAKNYQLDLFDPSGWHSEYSAAVTNEEIAGRNPPVASICERTGLSQARFAERLDISVRTLQDWE
jgi:DNA-binding transcriptional regulator YiaG